MDWVFRPSEAYDAIVFCNAVSTTEHYSRHYPGLRDDWYQKLGERGLHQIDVLHESTSMSRLCYWLEYIRPTTLDDLVSLCSSDRLEQLLESPLSAEVGDAIEHLIERKNILRSVFQRLKKADFDQDWQQRIFPSLSAKARELLIQAETFNIRQVQETLNGFLQVDSALLTTNVYVTHYTKPIAFQLPGGAMVCNNEHIPTPETLLRLAIHESIHGFPFSKDAQHEQDSVRRRSPAFDNHYQNLMRTFHSGPEEYFVVGAEAYITEKLGLRSYDDCLAYVDRQNGGMPFSKKIYSLLRETTPERNASWSGYGHWLVEQMGNGRLSTGTD